MVLQSAKPTILEVFDSLTWFRGADWTPWRAFLAAAFGLPLTDQEYEIFERCPGRRHPPKRRVSQCWVPAGRRARKSAIGAFVGTYLACFEDYVDHIAPGERARGLVMARDKDEAKQMHSFAKAILMCMPWMLEEKPSAETLVIRNHTELKIRACSITGGRSRAMFFAGLDELAFWKSDESAHPDRDVITGIEFGMANIPGAMLFGFSSPYAKKGVLWEKYDSLYGVESDHALVWKAPTLAMHRTPQIYAFVKKKLEEDFVAARAEVGNLEGTDIYFREDIEDYLSPELIDALTVKGRTQVAPVDRTPPAFGESPKPIPIYWGFVDTSGGTADSFCLGISHWDTTQGLVVLDYAGEWRPPMKVKAVTKEIAAILKGYGLDNVMGDKYAGQWPREEFAENGIRYEISPKTKDDIFRDSLPALTSRLVQLLENKTLRRQYVDLERRKSPKGIITIVHPPDGHDDLANAASGAIDRAYQYGKHLADEVIPPDQPRDTISEVERMVQEAIEEQSEGGEEDVRETMIDAWNGRWIYR